jgi:hypothetical protein
MKIGDSEQRETTEIIEVTEDDVPKKSVGGVMILEPGIYRVTRREHIERIREEKPPLPFNEDPEWLQGQVKKEDESGDMTAGVPWPESDCPECGEPARITCRCPRRDSSCTNDHWWHTCTVHRKIVRGKSDHGTDTFSCTCGEGE